MSGRPLAIAGQPLFALLLPVPVVTFVGAVLADFAYRGSGGTLIWLNFASWLILFGLAFGVLAALLLMVDVLRLPALRSGAGLGLMLSFLAGLVVGAVNMLVHNRDGWTGVVPTGLTLSILAAALLLAAGWLRRSAYGEDSR